MVFLGIILTAGVAALFLKDEDNYKWAAPIISGVLITIFIGSILLINSPNRVEIKKEKEIVFDNQLDHIDTVYVHLVRLDTIIPFNQIKYR